MKKEENKINNFNFLDESIKNLVHKSSYIQIGVLQSPIFLNNRKIPEGTVFRVYPTSRLEG